MDTLDLPYHYASADDPYLQEPIWIEQQWELGRLLLNRQQDALLILDEIQKIPTWSDMVKRLWDEDTRKGISLKVMLLGSSLSLVQKGLTESLAGRFEWFPMPHWSYDEMKTAFGWSLDQYLFYGGYPGSVPLLHDEQRWKSYILHALVETVISKDILLLSRVDKPALSRRLFKLSCDYSSQILSYTKMLGQLHDAGNTTTLAHYLELLSQAGLISGLQKYSPAKVRKRSSSPKLQVYNTALITAHSPYTLQTAQQDRNFWGRLVESAVGAYLLNTTMDTNFEIYYWRERGKGVDFIIQHENQLACIEVKSGRQYTSLPGISSFATRFAPQKTILVGGNGIPIEEFLSYPAPYWLNQMTS